MGKPPLVTGLTPVLAPQQTGEWWCRLGPPPRPRHPDRAPPIAPPPPSLLLRFPRFVAGPRYGATVVARATSPLLWLSHLPAQAVWSLVRHRVGTVLGPAPSRTAPPLSGIARRRRDRRRRRRSPSPRRSPPILWRTPRPLSPVIHPLFSCCVVWCGAGARVSGTWGAGAGCGFSVCGCGGCDLRVLLLAAAAFAAIRGFCGLSWRACFRWLCLWWAPRSGRGCWRRCRCLSRWRRRSACRSVWLCLPLGVAAVLGTSRARALVGCGELRQVGHGCFGRSWRWLFFFPASFLRFGAPPCRWWWRDTSPAGSVWGPGRPAGWGSAGACVVCTCVGQDPFPWSRGACAAALAAAWGVSGAGYCAIV